jgi:hypothetical protein
MRSGGFGLGTENASYEPEVTDAALCTNVSFENLVKPVSSILLPLKLQKTKVLPENVRPEIRYPRVKRTGNDRRNQLNTEGVRILVGPLA